MHLLVDATYQQLLRPAQLREVTPQLAAGIHMTPVGPTIVALEGHPWGCSFFQPIQESHISGHYWHSNSIMLDIFSCKIFNLQQAVNLMAHLYHLEDFLQVEFVERNP